MWRHVVLEGFCFGDIEGTERPCGKQSVSSFCLANGKCPHFAYADSNEREAALFVPMWDIIWDRIKSGTENFYWKARWYLWNKWCFHKTWEDMEAHTTECPAWDSALKDAQDKFPEWLEKVTKEYSVG